MVTFDSLLEETLQINLNEKSKDPDWWNRGENKIPLSDIFDPFANLRQLHNNISVHVDPVKFNKEHKWDRWIEVIQKIKYKKDLETMRREVNVSIYTYDKIAERVEKIEKLGECKETAPYYKSLKKNYIDKGITSKDMKLSSEWMKTTLRQEINKRMKEVTK